MYRRTFRRAIALILAVIMALPSGFGFSMGNPENPESYEIFPYLPGGEVIATSSAASEIGVFSANETNFDFDSADPLIPMDYETNSFDISSWLGQGDYKIVLFSNDEDHDDSEPVDITVLESGVSVHKIELLDVSSQQDNFIGNETIYDIFNNKVTKNLNLLIKNDQGDTLKTLFYDGNSVNIPEMPNGTYTIWIDDPDDDYYDRYDIEIQYIDGNYNIYEGGIILEEIGVKSVYKLVNNSQEYIDIPVEIEVMDFQGDHITTINSQSNGIYDISDLADGGYVLYGIANSTLQADGYSNSNVIAFEKNGNYFKYFGKEEIVFDTTEYIVSIMLMDDIGDPYDSQDVSLYYDKYDFGDIDSLKSGAISEITSDTIDGTYDIFFDCSDRNDYYIRSEKRTIEFSGGKAYIDSSIIPRFITIPMVNSNHVLAPSVQDEYGNVFSYDAFIDVFDNSNTDKETIERFHIKEDGTIFYLPIPAGTYEAALYNNETGAAQFIESYELVSDGSNVTSDIPSVIEISSSQEELKKGNVRFVDDGNILDNQGIPMTLHIFDDTNDYETQLDTSTGEFKFIDLIPDGTYTIEILMNSALASNQFYPLANVSIEVLNDKFTGSLPVLDVEKANNDLIFSIYDGNETPVEYNDFDYDFVTTDFNGVSEKVFIYENVIFFDVIPDGDYYFNVSALGNDSWAQSDFIPVTISGGKATLVNGSTPAGINSVGIKEGKYLGTLKNGEGETIGEDGFIIADFGDPVSMTYKYPVKHNGQVYVSNLNAGDYEVYGYGLNEKISESAIVSVDADGNVTSPQDYILNDSVQKENSITFNIVNEEKNSVEVTMVSIENLSGQDFYHDVDLLNDSAEIYNIDNGSYVVTFDNDIDGYANSDKYYFSVNGDKIYDSSSSEITTPIEIVLPYGEYLGVVYDYQHGATLSDSIGAEIYDDSGNKVDYLYGKSSGKLYENGLSEGNYYVKAFLYDGDNGVVSSSDKYQFTVDASGNIGTPVDPILMSDGQINFNFVKYDGTTEVSLENYYMNFEVRNAVDESEVYYLQTETGTMTVGGLDDRTYEAQIFSRDSSIEGYVPENWVQFVINNGTYEAGTPLKLRIVPEPNALAVITILNEVDQVYTGNISWEIFGKNDSLNIDAYYENGTFKIKSADNGYYDLVFYSREMMDDYANTDKITIRVENGKVYLDEETTPIENYNLKINVGDHFATLAAPSEYFSVDDLRIDIELDSGDSMEHVHSLYVKDQNKAYVYGLLPNTDYVARVKYYGKDHNWSDNNEYDFTTDEYGDVISPINMELKEVQVIVKGRTTDTNTELTSDFGVIVRNSSDEEIATVVNIESRSLISGLAPGSYSAIVEPFEDWREQGYVESDPVFFTIPEVQSAPIEITGLIKKINVQFQVEVTYNDGNQDNVLDAFGGVDILDSDGNWINGYKVRNGVVDIYGLDIGEYKIKAYADSEWTYYSNYLDSDSINLSVTDNGVFVDNNILTEPLTISLRPLESILSVRIINSDGSDYTGEYRDFIECESRSKDFEVARRGNFLYLVSADEGNYNLVVNTVENDDLVCENTIDFTVTSDGKVMIDDIEVTENQTLKFISGTYFSKVQDRGDFYEYQNMNVWIRNEDTGDHLPIVAVKEDGEIYVNSNLFSPGNYSFNIEYYGEKDWINVDEYEFNVDENGDFSGDIPDPIPMNDIQFYGEIELEDNPSAMVFEADIIFYDEENDEDFVFVEKDGKYPIGGIHDGTYYVWAEPYDSLRKLGYESSADQKIVVTNDIVQLDKFVLNKVDIMAEIYVNDQYGSPVYDYEWDLRDSEFNRISGHGFDSDEITYLYDLSDGEYRITFYGDKDTGLANSVALKFKVLNGEVLNIDGTPVSGDLSVNLTEPYFKITVKDTMGDVYHDAGIIVQNSSGKAVGFIDDWYEGIIPIGKMEPGTYYYMAIDNAKYPTMQSSELVEIVFGQDGIPNTATDIVLQLTGVFGSGEVRVIDDSLNETTNTDGIEAGIRNASGVVVEMAIVENGTYKFGTLEDGKYKVEFYIPDYMINQGYIKPDDISFTVLNGVVGEIPKVLIVKDDFVAGDATLLKSLIAEIEAYDLTGMETSGVNALNGLLANAKAVANNNLSTQEEIDGEYDKLADAKVSTAYLSIIPPSHYVDNTDPTSGSVTVMLTGYYDVMYSINGGEYAKYLEPIVLSNNGAVTYYSTYKEINSISKEVVVSNIDKVAPVIYINGEKEITVKLGENYVDDGAIAYDGDTLITDKIVVSGDTVDTNVSRVYEISYSVTDDAGNTVTKIRTVTVKDMDAPDIQTNLPDGEISIFGSTLELELNITDNYDTNIDVSVNGETVDQSVYTVNLTEGYNVITIKAEDDEGNIDQKAYTVVSLPLQIDPDITKLTNTDVALKLNVEQVTSDFKTSIIAEYSFDGNSWNALNLDSGAIVSESGNVLFRAKISGLTDYTTVETYTVDNIDKVPPSTPSLKLQNSEPVNTFIIVEITSNDKLFYRMNSKNQSDPWIETGNTLSLDENGHLEVMAKDEAGNESDIATLDISNIDKIAPINTGIELKIDETKVDGSLENYAKDGEVVSVSFEGDGDYGYVKVNDSSPYEILKNDGQFTFEIPPFSSSRKNVSIVIWSKDAAENMSNKVLVTDKLTVDVEIPVIQVSQEDIYLEVNSTDFETLEADAFDDLDGDISSKVSVNSNLDLSKVGEYRVLYNVSDKAGNNGVETGYTVYVEDTTKPEILTNLESTTVSKSEMEFTVNINDNYDKDIVPEVSLNETSISGTEGTYSAVLQEGINVIEIVAVDSSNNRTEMVYNVDYQMPVSDRPIVIASTTAPTNKDVVVEIIGTEGSEIQYSYNGATWTDYEEPIIFTENGVIYGRSRVNAESLYSEAVSYSITNIDKTPPAKPVIGVSNTKMTNQPLTVTITSTDEFTMTIDGRTINYDGPFTVNSNCVITAIAKDLAGNTASTVKSIENIDTTAPSGYVRLSNQNITNRNVFASIIINEQYEMMDGQKRYHQFTENGSYTFKFKDLAGNVGELTAIVTNIDKTTPSISNKVISVNGDSSKKIAKSGDIINLRFEVSENADVTLFFAGEIYNISTTAENDKNVIDKSFEIPKNYNGYVYISTDITDSARNRMFESIATGVKVDNVKPSLDVIIPISVLRGNRNIIVDDELTLNVMTDGTKVMYGETEASMNELSGKTLVMDNKYNDGKLHTILFKAYDEVGNESDLREISFTWDNNPPSKPVLSNSNETVNRPYYVLYGESEFGYVSIESKNGSRNYNFGRMNSVNLSSGIYVPLREGVNEISIKAVDLAGNVSEATIIEITLDSKNPLVTLTKDSNGNYLIEANEEIDVLGYYLNNGSFVSTSDTLIDKSIFAVGDNMLVVKVQDKAGNFGFGRLSFVNIVANEPIKNKELSDGLVLTDGKFNGNTELQVKTVHGVGHENADGNEFVSQVIDFSTSGNVGFDEPILVDLYVGTGLPEKTKLYYNNGTEWISLDKSQEHGDSVYNGSSSAVDYYLVNNMFSNTGTTEKKITVQSGHLVASLYHFSEYSAQADTTAPVVTITSPSDNYKTNEGSIIVKANVNEASNVNIYVNDSKTNSVSNVNGDFEISTGTLAEGSNKIELRATDLSSNDSTLNPSVLISTDFTKPVIDSNLVDNTVSGSSYGVEVDVTESNEVTTKIYQNDSVIYTTDSKDFTYVATLNEGDNRIYVESEDDHGNKNNTSVKNIILDTTAPTISVSGINDEDVVSEDVAIAVSLNEAGSWTAVYSDGITSNTVTSGTIDIPATEGSRKSYTLNITAKDSNDNVSTKSLGFVIDTAAPSITISGAPNGTYTNSDVNMTVDVTPDDADTTIKLYKDGSRESIIGNTIAITEDGSYSLEVEAINNGVVGEKKIDFIVDKEKPEITISGIADGSTYTSSVIGIFEVSDSYLDITTATYSKDGGDKIEMSSGKVFSENGSYSVEINAVDLAGNKETKTVEFTINISTSHNTGGSSGGGSSSGGTTPTTTTPTGPSTTKNVNELEKLINDGEPLTEDKKNAIEEKAIDTIKAAMQNINSSKEPDAVVRTISKAIGNSLLVLDADKIENVILSQRELVSKVIGDADLDTTKTQILVQDFITNVAAKGLIAENGNNVSISENTLKLVSEMVDKIGTFEIPKEKAVLKEKSINLEISNDDIKGLIEESAKAIKEVKGTLAKNNMMDVYNKLDEKINIKLSDVAENVEKVSFVLDKISVETLALANLDLSIESKGINFNLPKELLGISKEGMKIESSEVKTNSGNTKTDNGFVKELRTFDLDVQSSGMIENLVKVEIPLSKNELNSVDKLMVGVLENDKWKKIKYEIVDGKLIFTAPHFSIYSVMEYKTGFKDISGHWAEKYISAVSARNIISGKGENLFDPSGMIARAEFAKILVNMLNVKELETSSYSDVSSEKWYYGTVGAAAKLGLNAGAEGTNFYPDNAITREDMASMIAKAYEIRKGYKLSGEEITFADRDGISSYALEAVKAMKANGIINGYEDNTFRPENNATRAEAVTMIYKLLQK